MSNSIDNAFMKAALIHIAKTLGFLVHDSGAETLVCTADNTGCMKLEEWGKVLGASAQRKKIEKKYESKNKDIIKQYSICQHDDECCWAAVTVSAHAIREGVRYASELSYFEPTIERMVPTQDMIHDFFNKKIKNNSQLSSDEIDTAKMYLPYNNTLDQRTAFCAFVSPTILLNLIRASCSSISPEALKASNLTEAQLPALREEIIQRRFQYIRGYLSIKYNSLFSSRGNGLGLSREPAVERMFFTTFGFAYERISIPSFTPDMLTKLLANKPCVVAVPPPAMLFKGTALKARLAELEKHYAAEAQKPAKDPHRQAYADHYIAILDFAPEINTLYCLNTQPWEADSAADAGYSFKTASTGGPSHGQLISMTFSDFKAAIQTDYNCLRYYSSLSQQNVNTFSIMYLEQDKPTWRI